MTLATSSRLGPYEIISPIGAGGMGEVYKARDTRLDRIVAIKVLPGHLLERSDLRQRFEREARAISSLSHPNICSLFDIGVHDGQDYLVMEYLDGESLAQRLSKGPLSMDETFRYGIEIADALEVAHRHGIVHRDLKPGNVVLSKSGAKLLDFGLAKTRSIAGQSSSSDFPTEAKPITKEGTILGTLQYMAPEQVEAKESDGRTDIFAFGAILYEMATGHRAFNATGQATLIGAIMKDKVPPPSATQPSSTPEFDRIVRRCLEKDPDARWQSAGDLADELRWVQSASDRPAGQEKRPVRTTTANRLMIAAALLLAVATTAALTRFFLHAPKKAFASEMRFSISVPVDGSSIPQLATYTELAVSPDGTKIAFVAVSSVQSDIWVRSLESLEARRIDGTTGGRSPFWSPDSHTIGFFANGELKRVPIDGGTVTTICKGNGGSAGWSRDDRIIFCVWGPDVAGDRAATNAIHMVSAKGGTARPITSGEQWDLWPQFLPDGKRFLFFRNYGSTESRTGLYVQSTGGGKAELLIRSVSRGLITSDHHLFLVQDGVLVSQQLDGDGLRVIGEPSPIARSVFSLSPTGVADFSVSSDHSVIAYLRRQMPSELKWVDRNGRELDSLGPPAICSNFRISPDGSRVAEEITDPRSSVPDIWLMDVSRKALSRVTDEGQGAYSPIWERNGNSLIASLAGKADPTSAPQLHIVPLDGRPVVARFRQDGPQHATDVTQDDREVVYSVARGSDTDVERASLSGGKQIPVASSHFNEFQGVLSPDGNWIAFVSDESGRLDVYVQPFNGKGERVQVSTSGGFEPRWSRDGSELFFLDLFKNLNSVSVSFSPTFTPGNPTRLFRVNSAGMMEFSGFGSVHYDVSSNSQRFLIRTLPEAGDTPPIGVILNWKG